MTKSLKDILAGVKSSTVVPGSTGTQPGVDYAPKAPAEQDVVKKHKVEKHADRVGNGDDVYQATNIKHSQIKDAKHGYKKPEDQKVNEAKKVGDEVDVSPSKNNPDFKSKATVKFVGKGYSVAKDKSGKQYTIKHEETKCNMTEEGTHCPVHEMASCGSSKKKSLKEVLTKKTSAGKVIKDFQTSNDERFAGKSPEKRKEMALAAYYAKQRNESLAVPLIGSNGNGDDDESAEMAKTQLRALANKAMHLVMQLSDDQVVEPWIQAKIAVAKDNVSAVHDYMVYGNQDKPEAEQTAPYDGGIDMTGAPRNTYPNFSADVNTGRNV